MFHQLHMTLIGSLTDTGQINLLRKVGVGRYLGSGKRKSLHIYRQTKYQVFKQCPLKLQRWLKLHRQCHLDLYFPGQAVHDRQIGHRGMSDDNILDLAWHPAEHD
jgi:hypothetical protein